MSKTKRSSPNDTVRSVKPYRRKKHSEMLKEFETSYKAINQDPVIQL